MAKDLSKVILNGPANAYVNSVEQGFVADATVTITHSRIDAKVAEGGDTPVKSWNLATGATITLVVKETDLVRWQKLLGASAIITDGVTSALGVGKSAGTPITAFELKLEPQTQNAVANFLGTVTIYKCVPDGDFAISWNAEQSQPTITLKAQFDPTRNEGDKVLRIGDPAVSADATAPTVSPYAPLDDATGVAVATTIAATFSDDLLPETVNLNNVQVFAGLEASGPQTPVAGSISYDSALKKITFTPTSVLSGTTLYEVIWGKGIKNVSGLAFAGAKTSFTTT